MKIAKSIIAAVAVTALLLTGTTAANAGERKPAAPQAVSVGAAASSTGEYEWVCVLGSGNSWSMADGQATTECVGTYLQKYLNGSLVEVVNITSGSVEATATIACVLAVTTSLILALTPGGGWVWLAKTGARAAIAASNPCRA